MCERVCFCVCAWGMCVSTCDCNFKFWHPSLILGVVKCTVNKRKRGSSPPPQTPPWVFFFLKPRRAFHPLSGVTEWHHCVYVRGGECVGIEAFVLSRPPNLALSAPLLFWVRQKSSLFWDLCPGFSTDWTSHIRPSQSKEESGPGAGCEARSQVKLWGQCIFSFLDLILLFNNYGSTLVFLSVCFLLFSFIHGVCYEDLCLFICCVMYPGCMNCLSFDQQNTRQVAAEQTLLLLRQRRFCWHVRHTLISHGLQLLNHFYNRWLLFYIHRSIF